MSAPWLPSLLVSDWVLSPPVLVPAMASAFLYGLAVRRAGRRWPARRSASFAGGIACVVLALQSGIYRLDLGSGNLDKRFDPPYDPSRFRFNDGRTDRRGRFWVGNMPLKSLAGPVPVGESAFWYVEGGELRPGVDKMTIVIQEIMQDKIYLDPMGKVAVKGEQGPDATEDAGPNLDEL